MKTETDLHIKLTVKNVFDEYMNDFQYIDIL